MPFKSRERRRQYGRAYGLRWRANHKKLGLCHDCNRPVSFGAIRCEVHLHNQNIMFRRSWEKNHKIYNNRRKIKRQSYLEERRCRDCGAPLIEDEVKLCVSCKTSSHLPMIKGVLKYETNN